MELYRKYGSKSLKAVEHLVLIVIAIATVVAIGQEIVHIFKMGLWPLPICCCCLSIWKCWQWWPIMPSPASCLYVCHSISRL